MRSVRSTLILPFVFVAPVCEPVMATTTEPVRLGIQTVLQHHDARGLLTGIPIEDKATDSILGVATATLPAGVGETIGLAREAPLPMSVALGGYRDYRIFHRAWIEP
jgi:hypothetical protein